jgi:hypothetical protein
MERLIEKYKMVLNSIKLERKIQNREILKQCKTAIYKVRLMKIQTFNAETWIITKGNKSKIQAKDLNFFILREKQEEIELEMISLEKLESKIC